MITIRNGWKMPVGGTLVDGLGGLVQEEVAYIHGFSSSPDIADFEEGDLVGKKPGELHITLVAKLKDGRVVRQFQNIKVVHTVVQEITFGEI